MDSVAFGDKGWDSIRDELAEASHAATRYYDFRVRSRVDVLRRWS